ncbi:MAG: tRNA (guanosine(37)-N1)-methyltransferase TrmD [Chloroflexi bacterium]|nr:tRNA (guanosine(37)-N1)-methyltransferase TrmD [Chloroflexota bacterium]|tara:strand:- start:148788 stop:149504 length:717 start_codon:yes stop_codon:yes gene_type:complete
MENTQKSIGSQIKFDVITIFPEMFTDFSGSGVFARAKSSKIIDLKIHDLRDYSNDKHRKVDDYPFGGGPGMVLKPEPVFDAVESIVGDELGNIPIVLMSPQGRPLDNKIASGYSSNSHIVLICGRYEGFDERIRTHLATDEVSIGDYVISGGELASMVLMDAVSRFVPGVLGDEESAKNDSFSNGLLEHPHYTRPADFRGMKVPEVLISGNHKEINRWRENESVKRTVSRRPDLLGYS